MDLEHPDITNARSTGYPKKNTLTAMSASENNICADYSTNGDENKMLSSYAYDELNNFRNTFHKLYQHNGVIGINVDEDELRVVLKDLNTFLQESEGYYVEIQKNTLSDLLYTACFQINKVKFLLYMNEKDKQSLEGVLSNE